MDQIIVPALLGLLLIVLGVDFALFFNLLNMADTQGKTTVSNILFTIGIIGGIISVLFGLIRNARRTE